MSNCSWVVGPERPPSLGDLCYFSLLPTLASVEGTDLCSDANGLFGLAVCKSRTPKASELPSTAVSYH